jgi:PAS domain-containing protein
MAHPQPASGPTPSPSRMDIEQVRHILPQLIDALSDAVVVVDRAQKVVAANRRYLDAFGPGRAAVIGTHCMEVLHCPDAEANAGSSRCTNPTLGVQGRMSPGDPAALGVAAKK